MGKRKEKIVRNLDTSLAKWLSKRLLVMSEVSKCYPCEYESLERWQHDLQKHGNALRDYKDYPESFDEAKEAMQWVTDNFETLWW